MFYSEEEKSNFINDYLRSKVVAKTSLTGLFNKTAKYEVALNTDCSLFTKKEIIKMYKGFHAKSTNVLLNYNVILKAYTARQIYDGKAMYNAYSDITKDDMKLCISKAELKKQYLSREDVDEIEDQLLNFTDKAIIECLWFGIGGKSMKNLVNLNAEMVNNKTHTITFDDATYEVSQKLIYLLKNAFNETEYMCYGDTMRIVTLSGTGKLYKERNNAYTLDSDDKFFRWVYRKIQKYREYVGIPTLTMKILQASGLLYQLRMLKNDSITSIRDVLRTENGKQLAILYGYNEDTYIDVISNKFQDINF